MDYLERSKKEWIRASEFPANKEEVYPEHLQVQEFDQHHNKYILEYGCGGGSDAMSYLRRGNTVVATDIVPENIEATRKRIAEANLPTNKVELLLLENSYPLPLGDDKFDVISSHGVIHHIKDPEPVIREFYRVCKPDGVLYVMLYSQIMWDYFEERGMITQFQKMYKIDKYEAFGYCTDNIGTPYSRAYDTVQACDLLESSGFLVVDFNYWMNDHFVTYKCRK